MSGRCGGEEEGVESRSSWDFLTSSATSSLEPSSYRPWEGSELLLRGYYASPAASSVGYRLEDRLPSFESQFNEAPNPPGGNAPPPNNGYNNGHNYSPLPYPQIESSNNKEKEEKILLRLDTTRPSTSGASATSSSLDTHPTLVSQLTKKSTPQPESPNPSSSGDNPGQVAAISSTEPSVESSFKCPPQPPIGTHTTSNNNNSLTHLSGIRTSRPPSKGRKLGPDGGEKSTKKKRKRCGECSGCQKKDNCGDCAPCRNEKSHQICKVRRCERLIEKKPKKANVSSELTKLSPAPRTTQVSRQIELHQSPTPQSPHFGFNQTPNMTPNPSEANHWISQTNTNSSTSSIHQPLPNENWAGGGTHYQLSNHQPPPTQQNIFETHHFDSFIRRPPSQSSPLLLSPLNGPVAPPNRGGGGLAHGYHEIPSTSSGFLPVNGNGSSLGYNLAVNTETKPYISRSSPRSQQGNSQPGFPTRPYEELILPNYKPIQEGLPGEKRTGVSPDSTTTSNQHKLESKSFLYCEPQSQVSTANNSSFSSTTSKLISNDYKYPSALGSLFQRT